MEIINDDLSLNTRKFEINGFLYEISCTKFGSDKFVYNALDTVINRTNGNKNVMRRADLKIMLKKYNAKFVY